MIVFWILVGWLPNADPLPSAAVSAIQTVLSWVAMGNSFFPLDTVGMIAAISLPIILVLVGYYATLKVMSWIALIRKTFFI